MTIELQPCDCGSHAIILKQGDGAQSRACCAKGCAASTSWFTTPDEAAAVWNATAWRCFHCGDVFTDPQLARDHFGADLSATPVCQIPDLAHLLRMQEYELRGHREEDSQIIRQVYALGSEHYRANQDAEEKGYARGIEDAGKDWRGALEEIEGCFEAALAEGWLDALANGDLERIRDIWQRRIQYAHGVASAKVPTP
jgi:hypothetical protein